MLLTSVGFILVTVFHMLLNGVYATIPLVYGIRTHAYTFMLVNATLLYYYYVTGYLYPLTRLTVALTFTVLTIHTYDFLWGLNSWVVRGTGINKWSLVFIIVAAFFVERLDNVHKIWTSKYVYVSLFMLTVVLAGFSGMYVTGFWEEMTLSDLALGGDPNHNVFWIIGKTASFFVYFPLVAWRSDWSRKPLVLDAGVLTY